MERADALTATLREAQRLGFLGDRAIAEAIAHSAQFVEPLRDLPPGGRVLDLGSGGGLPGLVIAAARPDLDVVLLDRREKRTDFLARAVLSLQLDRVEVWCRDAGRLAAAIGRGDEAPFDVATARGFGPPEHTLRLAVSCVTGSVIISEPPVGDRWSQELLDELGVSHRRVGTVAVFDRVRI